MAHIPGEPMSMFSLGFPANLPLDLFKVIGSSKYIPRVSV